MPTAAAMPAVATTIGAYGGDDGDADGGDDDLCFTAATVVVRMVATTADDDGGDGGNTDRGDDD